MHSKTLLSDKDKKEEPKKTYPFIKPISQFENINPYRLPKIDQSDAKTVTKFHTASTMTKKLKSGTSAEYNTNRWFKISNPAINEKHVTRVNRMVVLVGELFRLLDSHQTKYRIVQDGDKQYPISKEIKGGKVFFDYFNENLVYGFKKVNSHYVYKGDDFKEGMGRGLLGKYFYLDNDFHADNAFIDGAGYFDVIDNDQCFWTWSRPLHVGFFKVTDPNVTVEDYDNFPRLKSYKPNNWLPQQSKLVTEYFDCFNKKSLFKNEKHFATIKLLVTAELQRFLLQYHIEGPVDKEELLKILNSRFQIFTHICQESKPFKNYLLMCGSVSIMQAVIFEMCEFFKLNKKYTQAKVDWSVYIDHAINGYSKLMELVLKNSLTTNQKNELKNFATIMFSSEADSSSKAEAIGQVEKFYVHQEMKSFAEIAKKQRESLPKMHIKP